MHPDQVDVTEATARTLVTEQFPQWRNLSVRRIAASGTVNAIFRIGDSLVARFPLQPGDPGAVAREARAAKEILGRTRFPTPEPVALGRPGHGYPMPWSVQTWLPGTPATDVDAASVPFALDLAEFIRGVRAIDPRGRTFTGTGRGGTLRSHDAWMATCIEKSEDLLDARELRRSWARYRELPPNRLAVMNHGDLIPGNVLVADGRLTGVLDVGGLTAADPALDLVAAWHLLDEGPRAAFRADLGCDDAEWERGKAWAFQQAMGLVWYYVESNPPMSRTGRRTLERILRDG
ncbi:aminoglycoside phosphotransferase family protein [Virgisporangium aurantiacum]|uniref:Putative phosphotransferase n=1 Tax=Virgisporangium aurantiacum TaxID=175570 RepID=A0A8J3ZFV4_9ACTN|nr:aminoglycoside phosphotransferase family protein [Virgisporangium aurantiacum]GIJ63379.1 putative phosphotransferase [Virgisporangium aurantiacum]